MDSKQLYTYVIKPTLQYLNLYSKDAARLILFTAANESLCGHYVKQLNGPALGIYQCEVRTYNDIVNFIQQKNDLLELINNLKSPGMLDTTNLILNLAYATAICRCFYLRIPEELPDADDIDAIWEYYKKYYNTSLGKATKNSFFKNIDITDAIKVKIEG
jgi:hypothetical protein